MNLILSRKGFDSAAGGCPSPILPDGRMVSLPIPDAEAEVRYGALSRNGIPLGGLVRDLTGGRIGPEDRAHLDPDLVAGEFARPAGWRPAFGQCDAAQTHLANQGVGVGDLFLFFGLFREVEEREEKKGGLRFRYKPGAAPIHCLWGWMRVGEVIDLDARLDEARARFPPHPHLVARAKGFARNTLYAAADRLRLPGRSGPAGSLKHGENAKQIGVCDLPGAGIFARFHPALRLTDPGERRPSRWRLPGWFMPYEGGRAIRPPLSYHANPGRWSRDGADTLLSCVGRGQEFVLDAGSYPESVLWLEKLLETLRRTR